MSYRLPQHCDHRPPSITNNHPRSYNLDIRTYSYPELLNIFGLPTNPSLDDLKTAKKKMLMVHPDKSNLPPDYFMFYKKAYEIIVNHVRDNLGEAPVQSAYTHQVDTNTSRPVYVPATTHDPAIAKQINATMKRGEFNQQFNSIFDENASVVYNERRNAWFQSDTPTPLHYDGKVSQGNMGTVFSDLKRKQQQQAMVQYTGVRELSASSGSLGVGNFHETVRRKGMTNGIDDDEDEGDDVEDVYISSDPFSKLKFDDLRKVYRDQTIFNVGEEDYNPNSVYSHEQMKQMRASVIDPYEKREAERMLEQQQHAYLEKMAKKKHRTEMQLQYDEELNQRIQSQFLLLGTSASSKTHL